MGHLLVVGGDYTNYNRRAMSGRSVTAAARRVIWLGFGGNALMVAVIWASRSMRSAQP
jgi:hypothetical protein